MFIGLLWSLLALMTSGPPALAGNLLSNGGFEKGLTEEGEPEGWHTRLTGIIPVPQYEDPENKKGRTGVTHFECGCGHDWGTVRPWAQLWCPKCGQMNIGLEDSGELYLKNHEFVGLVNGRSGRGMGFRLNKAVGEVQGVRVISDLVEAESEAGYEISFDAISQGPVPRVFVECFRRIPGDTEAAEWVSKLPPDSNPLKQGVRLKRVFRKQVAAESPRTWTRFSEQFVPPKRYRFDAMFVTLYAYMPGEAAYDNVVLRKLSRAELAVYLKSTPQPKDPRFQR